MEDREPPGRDFDNPFTQDTPPLETMPPALDYRAVAARLEGNAARLAEWAKTKHGNSDGPASPEQYRTLAGVLDTLLGGKKRHNALLGVLIGRAVDKTNPPGEQLVGLLLDYVLKERTETVDGKKTKVANPQYRQDIADTLIAIWQMAHAA